MCGCVMAEETVRGFKLPGFRFHPTEEELLEFYLKNMIYGKKTYHNIIELLNIYRYEPWELPGLARVGEREWYFFVPRDRKHSNGGRPNRTTKHGFWKATGSDRKIVSLSEPKRVIGLRKTLVFYQGRAPRGSKTDWVMNEYRLPDNCPLPKDIVLCKIYRKATSLKELELRAGKEESIGGEDKSNMQSYSYPTSPLSSSNGTASICWGGGGGQLEDLLWSSMPTNHATKDNIMTFKKEKFDEIMGENNCKMPTNTIQLPFGRETLGELQVPKSTMECTQDPHCSQSCSPWLENLLNFSSPTLLNLTQFLST